jgi:hypothetical protein
MTAGRLRTPESVTSRFPSTQTTKLPTSIRPRARHSVQIIFIEAPGSDLAAIAALSRSSGRIEVFLDNSRQLDEQF